MVRGLARVFILVASDVALYLALRWAVSLPDTLLSPALASWLARAVLQGVVPAWEFAVPLVIGLAFADSYARGDARRDGGSVFTGVTLAAGLVLWRDIWMVGIPAFVVRFASTVTVIWATTMLGRLVFDRLVAWYYHGGSRGERVLFVGNPGDPRSVRVQSRLVEREQMLSLGWVSPTPAAGNASVVGGPADIWDVLERTLPETVVICGTVPDEVYEPVVEACAAAGCRVLTESRFVAHGSFEPGLVWHSGFPFVQLTVPSLKAQQLLLKRVIDLFGAGLGIVALSPFFVAIAAAIKLDSPGPVFFTQERVGHGGRVFRFLKFRTMRRGADEEKSSVAHLNHSGDPRLFKIRDDPRVTRLGALLRRWSLDELPQLFNVLMGDMSLVGQRPFFESDLAGYSDHHFSRLGAKPGITGLWQVSGRSLVADFEEVVRLDREYIDRWSLLLDFHIILRTIPAVLGRSGAF